MVLEKKDYRTSMAAGRFWLGAEEIAIANFSDEKAYRWVMKDLVGIVEATDEDDEAEGVYALNIQGKANHDKARKKGYLINSDHGFDADWDWGFGEGEDDWGHEECRRDDEDVEDDRNRVLAFLKKPQLVKMCKALDVNSVGVKAELWQGVLDLMQDLYDKGCEILEDGSHGFDDDELLPTRSLEAVAQVAKALTKPEWVAIAKKLYLCTDLAKVILVEHVFFMLLLMGDKEEALDGKHDDLAKEASFFLLYAELSWPCDLKTLKGAWKRLAKETHPDNVATGNAQRFKILSEGFAVLKKRI